MSRKVYIQELQDLIRKLHGVESTYVRSVAVQETLQGKTVWDGIVEVFDLKGDPKVARAYAWAQNSDDPRTPHRHVTVLHPRLIQCAQDAVKAAILRGF